MRLRLLFALLLVAGFIPVLGSNQPVYAPGAMPHNLAAYELAEEPDYAKAKLATMQVRMQKGVCSGTAIGPTHYRVLTALHCIKNGTTGMRFGDRTGIVLRVERDDFDGVILTTDIYFTHIAKFGPRPKQGDVVFSHGNPDATPDILLVGRVAGWVANYYGATDVMLLDRNDWYGCSGAAVFNRDGRIVGIVNSLYPWPNQGWRLTAVYPLKFTPEQYTGTAPLTEAEKIAMAIATAVGVLSSHQ